MYISGLALAFSDPQAANPFLCPAQCYCRKCYGVIGFREGAAEMEAAILTFFLPIFSITSSSLHTLPFSTKGLFLLSLHNELAQGKDAIEENRMFLSPSLSLSHSLPRSNSVFEGALELFWFSLLPRQNIRHCRPVCLLLCECYLLSQKENGPNL